MLLQARQAWIGDWFSVSRQGSLCQHMTLGLPSDGQARNVHLEITLFSDMKRALWSTWPCVFQTLFLPSLESSRISFAQRSSGWGPFVIQFISLWWSQAVT